MSRTGTDLRLLPFLHAAMMLGLATAWVYACWTESPMLMARLSTPGPGGRAGLDHAFAVLSASLGDVLLGLCTLFLLAMGTGVYVRRCQTWIDARSAGEAVTYGSVDLKDQALAANAKPGTRR